jgi:hypothetical protein
VGLSLGWVAEVWLTRILPAVDHRLHHVEPWVEQRADDPLYVPDIVRVRESLGRRGLLYVGDGKMGALETRAFIQACVDAYRSPLSAVQRPTTVWEGYLMPIWRGHTR